MSDAEENTEYKSKLEAFINVLSQKQFGMFILLFTLAVNLFIKLVSSNI